MTTPSPDARAVVAAVDRLTTQVRRLADIRQTRTDAPATTADDAEKACPTPLTHNWGCGCPTDEAPAAHTQTLRWARRESLLVLLTRVQHGRTLTDDEARTLRHHVETEMREAEQLRARTDTMRAELEQAQAAIARVQQACHELPYEHARRVLAALDGTEQPTTKDTPEPLRVTPCDPPRMAVHCCGQCIAIAPSDPDLDRIDRIALVGGTITVVIGTPGGPPPSTGKGAHLIAEVEVPRGTTAITAAHITSAGLIFYRPDA